MRLLLDTHTLLWWLSGDRKLSANARSAIGSEENTVYVSAASAWEISTKHRLGKLDATTLIGEMAAMLAEQDLQPLEISVDHAERAGLLPGDHRDPFDRMLIAQSQAENLTLVSNETLFDGYGITRLW